MTLLSKKLTQMSKSAYTDITYVPQKKLHKNMKLEICTNAQEKIVGQGIENLVN